MLMLEKTSDLLSVLSDTIKIATRVEAVLREYKVLPATSGVFIHSQRTDESFIHNDFVITLMPAFAFTQILFCGENIIIDIQATRDASEAVKLYAHYFVDNRAVNMPLEHESVLKFILEMLGYEK